MGLVVVRVGDAVRGVSAVDTEGGLIKQSEIGVTKTDPASPGSWVCP
jgi:hypothetical protein